MSRLSALRDEIYTRILLKKGIAGFTINGFTLTRTYYPYEKLEEFKTAHPFGIVYVIGMNSDDLPLKSRTNLTMAEVPVQIAYQRFVEDTSDYTEIDSYENLIEELRDVCRKEVDLEPYAWMQNEALRDENGVPFSFTGLRKASTFEGYFTAHYTLPVA